MSQDGAFSNACVAHAHLAKLLLHALHDLVDTTDAACVLPKRDNALVTAKYGLKILLQNLPAVDQLWFRFVRRGNGNHLEGAVAWSLYNVLLYRRSFSRSNASINKQGISGGRRFMGVSRRV